MSDWSDQESANSGSHCRGCIMEAPPMLSACLGHTIAIWLLALCASGLELAPVFGDHMVLPMDAAVPVWGRAEPGSEVSVSFGDSKLSTTAGENGTWRVVLPRLKACSDGRMLRVSSGKTVLELADVLVGEVWLCAGQSNMDFPLARATGGHGEANNALSYPGIRLLDLSGVHTSKRRYYPVERQRMTPERYFEGEWQRATRDSAKVFSAVGWWAGKEIHLSKGVPVGLIDCSVGGSGTEAWLPSEVLRKRPTYADLLSHEWIESPRISSWARGRGKLNLGGATGNHPFRPGFLFEAGVRRWSGFPIAGVLWYQGETNAEIHDDRWNEQLLNDLVVGWRQVMELPHLPFFMVQLPRIGGADPMRKWWPEYRKVQERVAKGNRGVTLIKTVDLGWDSPDVHPPDKRPVGERLGRSVAALTGKH